MHERSFDGSFWVERIAHAAALRKRFLPPNTNAYRLVHAEGDRIPGFIADVYGDVVVAQVLTKGTELVLPHLLDGLRAIGFSQVYIKNKEAADRFEKIDVANGWVGDAAASTDLTIEEHGLQFRVDIEGGQKTGFFIDQRENRRLLGAMCHDARVLNAFSYSGGFSVYALEGGASAVTSVDVAAGAVEQAAANVALNFPDLPSDRHEAITADCFEYLRADENRYDVVVLDPPSFARTPKAANRAARGYKDLNLNAIKHLEPGGLLFTFSCTGVIDRDLFRKIVFSAAAEG